MLLAVYSLITIVIPERSRTLNDRFLYSNCLLCLDASVLCASVPYVQCRQLDHYTLVR
ncbi:hypothetical protein Hanom_Chr14g01278121 [Helianthus anomalus]